MPFSPIINFLMMERKKAKPKAIEDEFAIIKAAAWAWYERGSGSEGKPIREFDFTNSRKVLVPSRYKIEAIKNITAMEEHHNSPSLPANSTCHSFNSSLLDGYEIESISKDLDHYIESSNFDRDGCARVARGHRQRVVAVSKVDKEGEEVKKVIKSKRLLSKGGFLTRHGVVCGSINDVVAARNNIVGGVRGRLQPEKRAPAVKGSRLHVLHGQPMPTE